MKKTKEEILKESMSNIFVIEEAIFNSMQIYADQCTADKDVIIQSQFELHQSMGETNRQLNKRLAAIQDELSNQQSSLENIYLILNPKKP